VTPALRLGLIGCGRVVERFHLEALRAIPEARVVSLMDADARRLQVVGDLLGIDPGRRHRDYRRLLDERDLDAVSISTPPGSHAEIAVAAAEAGKHVVCEKPMATTLADADAMIAAARRHRVLLSVHHNYLWFPENEAAVRVIRAGRLGALVFTTINCLGLPYFGGTWRLHDLAASGGGILLDMLHLIYLTNAFFQAAPLRVDARVGRVGGQPIRVEDFALVRVEYPAGYGEINVSWGRGWGGTQLMGTEGRLLYAYRHFTSVNYERPDRLVLITERGETDIAFPPAPPFSEGPFRQFVTAALSGAPLRVSGEDGRAAVEIALAGYESAALRRTVALPLAPDDPVYRRGVVGLAELPGAAPEVLSLYGLAAGGQPA
jgi:predicted dehydrogenase